MSDRAPGHAISPEPGRVAQPDENLVRLQFALWRIALNASRAYLALVAIVLGYLLLDATCGRGGNNAPLLVVVIFVAGLAYRRWTLTFARLPEVMIGAAAVLIATVLGTKEGRASLVYPWGALAFLPCLVVAALVELHANSQRE